jgi:dienelactone hydrolase
MPFHRDQDAIAPRALRRVGSSCRSHRSSTCNDRSSDRRGAVTARREVAALGRHPLVRVPIAAQSAAMKLAVLVLLVACSSHPPAAAPAPPPTLAGTWSGSVAIPGQPLAIEVTFDPAGKGTIDVPAQGATGLALSHVTLVGDAVAFELAQVGAAFRGTLHGDAIAGTMAQSGQTFPFTLARRRAPRDAYVPPPRRAPLDAARGAALAGSWRGTADRDPLVAELAGDRVISGAAILGPGCPHAQPLANIAYAPPHVHFELGTGAYFDGDLAGDTIAGTLHRAGRAQPFTLRREAAPPYRTVEVAFASRGTTRLAGTLTLPASDRAVPAVVLVTGSGPQDRDECVFGVRPFRQLADHLARHGIATLRYDDRGTASSTGDFRSATTDDFADDADAAVRLLAARPEIDHRRIGVLGHSEGGVIAPLVAVRDRTVAFIVLWAAPGLPMEAVDLQQTADMLRAGGASVDAVEHQVALERTVLAALRTTTTDRDFAAALRAAVLLLPAAERAELGDLDAWVAGKVKENGGPWLRWYLDYDPAATLAKVTCPVLALNGALDTQVAARENLAAIHAANPRAAITELPGLNHLFQRATTGAPAEYGVRPDVDPAVFEATSSWLARVAR